MYLKPLFSLFFFLFFGDIVYTKTIPIDSLEKRVDHYNDFLEYKHTIQILSDFIADGKVSSYEKYRSYLLKSKIYKKLFNYEQALYNLDLALQEGIKSEKRDTIEQEIKAEKAFIYFDMQQFDTSIEIMYEIEKSNYKNLKPKYLLFLFTQEGYFLIQNKNYEGAEKKLNQAVEIARRHHPENLPVVYGKLIELYNDMHDEVKRDKVYEEGIELAKKYGIIKYEFYLYEIMKNVFRKNNDYKNAFDYQQKCDSAFLIYNSNSNSSKVELLEQQIKKKEHEFEIQNRRNIQFFLVILSVLLLFVLIIFVKLYLSNKQKRFLVERENKRIHSEIERLTKITSKKGSPGIDLSVFNLTERQLEIIKLVQQGKSNKEIASALYISDNTVKYHLKTIYNILNIKQRNELYTGPSEENEVVMTT